MKINVPIDLDINLTPKQIVMYLKDWLYPILRKYEREGSEYTNSEPVVKDNTIYWKYLPNELIVFKGDEEGTKYQEIKIPDERIFNLCKTGVEFISAYERINHLCSYDDIRKEKITPQRN